MNKINNMEFKMNQEVDMLYDAIIDAGIATEKEISLVTSINGYSVETLNSILYSRTGYRSWSQFEDMVLEEMYESETYCGAVENLQSSIN
tara:strand:- start:1944 stop:2213 length:270 start_codon:yes stop_codon:yes gene_type:complete